MSVCEVSPFFEDWPYQHLVRFLVGPKCQVSTNSRMCNVGPFVALPMSKVSATDLAAVVRETVRRTTTDLPFPRIDVRNTRALVIDVDAPHAKCGADAEPGARLCATCGERVRSAIARIRACVENEMKLGRMLWFYSSSRGAHGYILNPDLYTLAPRVRHALVKTIARRTRSEEEMDVGAARDAHWIRMPCTVVPGAKDGDEPTVLAPILDPDSFDPFRTPRVALSDSSAIAQRLAFAARVVGEARREFPVRTIVRA